MALAVADLTLLMLAFRAEVEGGGAMRGPLALKLPRAFLSDGDLGWAVGSWLGSLWFLKF